MSKTVSTNEFSSLHPLEEAARDLNVVTKEAQKPKSRHSKVCPTQDPLPGSHKPRRPSKNDYIT
eukprot:5131761-Amphidinium_carterae.1